MKFQPGSPGRLSGTRNKLTNRVIEDILVDWRDNGPAAIKTMRTEDPSAYVRVVCSILPKELTVENVTSDLSDDDLDELIASIKQRLLEQRQQAALPQPKIIEHTHESA